MDDLKWWERRVHALAGRQKEAEKMYRDIKNIFPEAEVYKKRPWAFDKLVLLSHYIDIYSNIIEKQKWVNNMVYVDLFAGPGFNMIEGYDEVVPGSPLLAQLMPRKGKEFDSMLLFEQNDIRARTLRLLLPKAQVYSIDSNSQKARKIIQAELDKPKSHFLAFIDPEGTDCHWSTIELLLKRKGDLILNCQYNSAARNVGTFRGRCDEKTKTKIEERLTRYFGTRAWQQVKGDYEGELERNLKELYINRLRRYRDKIVETHTGQEKGGYKYAILVATRKTKGGSPWLNAIEDARDRIHRISHSELEKWIDFYRGRRESVDIQSSMDDYW
ncbi:MAG: three-Cys-motif partner protein TcmP [Candidatus Thorarchaeota archaeon]|jgi:three-Cys-motif partner protein